MRALVQTRHTAQDSMCASRVYLTPRSRMNSPIISRHRDPLTWTRWGSGPLAAPSIAVSTKMPSRSLHQTINTWAVRSTMQLHLACLTHVSWPTTRRGGNVLVGCPRRLWHKAILARAPSDGEGFQLRSVCASACNFHPLNSMGHRRLDKVMS